MPTDPMATDPPDVDRIPFRDDLSATGPAAARSRAAAAEGLATDPLAALQSAGLVAIRAMRNLLDAAEMALAHPGALAGVVGAFLDTARTVVADVVAAGAAAVASDSAGAAPRPDAAPAEDVGGSVTGGPEE